MISGAKRVRFITALFCALTAPSSAIAMCDLTKGPSELFNTFELSRYQNLFESRAKGLAGALVGVDDKDRLYLSNLLATPEPGAGQPPLSGLEGHYLCRVAKLGRIASLTVYASFKCQITVQGGTARLVKTSGSQRLTGYLMPFGQGFAYYGALHYGDEQPKEFGAEADRNQVGCLVALEDGRLRLDLPQPHYDSDHDIMIFDQIMR